MLQLTFCVHEVIVHVHFVQLRLLHNIPGLIEFVLQAFHDAQYIARVARLCDAQIPVGTVLQEAPFMLYAAYMMSCVGDLAKGLRVEHHVLCVFLVLAMAQVGRLSYGIFGFFQLLCIFSDVGLQGGNGRRNLFGVRACLLQIVSCVVQILAEALLFLATPIGEFLMVLALLTFLIFDALQYVTQSFDNHVDLLVRVFGDAFSFCLRRRCRCVFIVIYKYGFYIGRERCCMHRKRGEHECN
mmetsp:Transcript_88090/g.139183  ORF Transcript_88090/g.139183 Transcript_88090/m.139183 type:complete len:241 (-) Transcript_88090:47-769(-)